MAIAIVIFLVTILWQQIAMKIKMVKTKLSVFQPNYLTQLCSVHNIQLHNLLHDHHVCFFHIVTCDCVYSSPGVLSAMEIWLHQVVRLENLPVFPSVSGEKGYFPNYLEKSKSDLLLLFPLYHFYSSSACDWKSYGAFIKWKQ